MFNDDISKEFLKIAMEKGLIKEAEESKELKEYKNSPYPRVGSDSISTIEALYGIKPDAPKDMQYIHNIVEDAHPNQVIIAPSYDKLNGLVENLNERQQILINIMHKPVNGNLTHKKYAESELAYALTRVANDMDNRDIDQLRVLADTCLEQLNTITKEAIGPLAIVGIAAAVLAAVYLYNHVNDPDQGILANTENAISAVDSLIGEDWFHQTFYATLKPEFVNNLKKFKSDLESLRSEAKAFNEIELKIHSLKTAEELKNVSEESGQEIVHKAEQFRTFLQNIAPEINQAIEEFSSSTIKQVAIKDESWLSQLTGKFEGLLHGGWGLFTDRFDDIKKALAPLKQSMDATVEEINRLDDTAENRKAQVAKAMQQVKEYAPRKAIETPTIEAKEPAASEWATYEKQLREL